MSIHPIFSKGEENTDVRRERGKQNSNKTHIQDERMEKKKKKKKRKNTQKNELKVKNRNKCRRKERPIIM